MAWSAASADSPGPPPQVAVVEVDEEIAVFVGDETYQLTLRRVARRFYEEHEDRFDTLVVLPTFNTTVDGEALYEAVANDVVGLNIDMNGLSPETFDLSVGGGYGGDALEGIVQFGNLALVPDGPSDPYLGPWTTLDVLAQEVAHRYGAFIRFSDGDAPSDALLSADGAHWSFFLDSGGSPLGGNAWVETAEGAWRTGPPTNSFGPLDLYLLGLLPAGEVGDIRLMVAAKVIGDSLDAAGRPYGRDSLPAAGVTVDGVWKTVSIDDIVAVERARTPAAPDAPAIRRHAFVAVHRAGDGGVPDDAFARAERLRAGWSGRYAEVTDGRGRVLTRLDGRDDRGEFPRDPLRHGWRKEGDAWIHDKLLLTLPEDADHVALQGEGVGRVRRQDAGGAWSDGVVVELPGVASLDLSPTDGYAEVYGLKLEPEPGRTPPELTALWVGPADEVAARAPGGGDGCGCRQSAGAWFIHAWTRRRG